MQLEMFYMLKPDGEVISERVLRSLGVTLPYTNPPNLDFPSFLTLATAIKQRETRKDYYAGELIPATVSINSLPYPYTPWLKPESEAE